MKTRLITSVALMLFAFSAAMAGSETNDSSNEISAAGKLLENRIMYPSVAEYNGETGYVTFELSMKDDKTVEFKQLASDNSLISENVKKQVLKLEHKLAKLLKPGETQKFRLVFLL